MKTVLPITLLVPMLVALAPTGVEAQQQDVPDADNLCIACHGNSDVWEGDTRHLFVPAEHLVGDVHWQKGIKCQGCHGGNPKSTNLREAHAAEDGFRQITTPSDIPGFCGHCHSDATYMGRFQKEPKVDQVADFWDSVHGKYLKANPEAKDAAACNACHTKHAIRPAQDPQSSTHPSHMAETCGNCHKQQQTDLLDSVHGKQGQKDEQGVGTAIGCGQCHGDNLHRLLPVRDPGSPVFVDNQVNSCGNCHEKGLESYLASVHGRGLVKSGLLGSAVCSSCHGAHGIHSASDSRSRLHVAKVAATCGECHLLIQSRLEHSVHGGDSGPGGAAERAAPGGVVKQKPSCTNCHQGHDQPDPQSASFRLQLPSRCGDCHAELSQRYLLSLHGELTEIGFGPAAKCSDCHGDHEILPVSDPQSKVSGQNRLETCRKCHAAAPANFADFDPHADHHDPKRDPVLHAVYVVLMTFLLGTLGSFGVHSILWFVRELIEVLRHGRHRTLEPGTVAYMRFTMGHRVGHALLFVSFLGLALTGLPLKYGHTGWGKTLAAALGGFDSTRVWHRIFGLTNIGCLLVAAVRTFWWLAVRPRENAAAKAPVFFGPDSPVPTVRDIKDFFKMIRWFFGLGPKPTFERWTYWEKFDFWGAVADIVIIGLSGLILWFPDLFCSFLPGKTLNIAKVIHSTQALLATGFVFAIHFFSTHLRPSKFPMDMVMFTGVVSEDELRAERPEYYERLRREGKLDALRFVIPRRRVTFLMSLSGYMALTVGLALLAGIFAAILGGGTP